MKKRKRKDWDECVKDAYSIHGPGYSYEPIGQWKNFKSPIKLINPEGRVYLNASFYRHISIKVAYLARRSSGYNNLGRKLKYTTENFIEKANKIHKFKYSYESAKYLGALKDITITCPIHGPFDQTASHHLEGHGCKKCGRKIVSEKFKELHRKGNTFKGYTTPFQKRKEVFKEIHNDAFYYTNTEEFIPSYSKIEVICKKCGYTFYPTISNHLFLASGCPHCNNSKMEKEVIRLAGDLIIKNQKTFPDLLGVKGYELSFDHCFKDFLLECQGQFHFGTTRKGAQSEEKLKVQKEHDRRKVEYCTKNGLALEFIYYWEDTTVALKKILAKYDIELVLQGKNL